MPLPYVRIVFKDEDGTLALRWRQNVARLDDMVLKCPFFLYANEDEANDGSRRGGTGFVVGCEYEARPGWRMVYGVTAAHNLDDGFRTIRVNDRSGRFVSQEIPEGNWFRHSGGADIAITPMVGVFSGIDVAMIASEIALTPERCAKEDIGIGDDVYQTGRLLAYEGSPINRPAVKFGHISMMPNEPLPCRDMPPQDSFVVEMRSVGGFSGSPVFVYKGHDPFGESLRLLGLTWCHLRESGIENAGMVGVIPSWNLTELLYRRDVVKDRRQNAKENLGLVDDEEDVVVLESSETLTREGFMDALKEVSRPDEPQPDEASE